MARLLAAISSHGFGHLAQCAPVLCALRAQRPELALTVRSGLDTATLAARIDGPFEHQREADDFGMRQRDAFRVDVAASAAAYARFHADWEARVEAVAAQLAATAPDLVLADVPYLTLAAAARAGIPAVALCSLNWADIYHHYCAGQPGAEAIHAQMLAAYRSAALFLRPAPSMPMPALPNTRAIGPVAAPGRWRREAVAAALGLAPAAPLVLVATGGFDTALPVAAWARSGLNLIVPDAWAVPEAEGVYNAGRTGFRFQDLIASVDVFVTKPGYGSFAEAAAAGTPVVYLPRGDWPEEPCLIDRMQANGLFCRGVNAAEADSAGPLLAAVQAGLAAGRQHLVAPTGVGEAAALLDGYLER